MNLHTLAGTRPSTSRGCEIDPDPTATYGSTPDPRGTGRGPEARPRSAEDLERDAREILAIASRSSDVARTSALVEEAQALIAEAQQLRDRDANDGGKMLRLGG